MKRIVRLTESDLTRIVRRVIMEVDVKHDQMANSIKTKTGFSGVGVGPENGVTYIEGGKGGSLYLKYNCKTKKDILGSYNTSNIQAELDYFCANPKTGSW